MYFQGVALSEAFIAQFALVRALFGVDALVLRKSLLSDKRFTANGANERLLAGMRAQMHG